MREIYAVELRTSGGETNSAAWPLIEDWLRRHVPESARDFEFTWPRFRLEERGPRVSADEGSDGSRVVVLDHPDQGDETTSWISEIAVGPPQEPCHITVRIRLAPRGSGVIAPMRYEFRTPAIVRTLLGKVTATDAGDRVSPDAVLIGHSSVSTMVKWLSDPERRLPAVVVSRTNDKGATLLDEGLLARELAGLAHVRVLTSSFASRRLSDEVGQDLSVWDGAVRVYFPQFSLDDERRRHRVYAPYRVDDRTIGHLRSWLGAVSSLRTPPHPAIDQLRADRRRQVEDAADQGDITFVHEYIEEVERAEQDAQVALAEEQERTADLQEQIEDLRAELDDTKSQFAVFQRETLRSGPEPVRKPRSALPTTVEEAVEQFAELAQSAYYASRVELTDSAIRTAKEFSNYQKPEEMVAAVQAVLEAGSLYHDDRLGESPGEFFARRGFGYGSRPTPHLKVDEATSPDQCLRVYWDVDEEERLWRISEIGRHR